MERAVSVLGLFVLMGVAYLFSRDRSAISYRTIVWGVGLQALFATILLGSPTVSFVGMFLLLCLIVTFVAESALPEGEVSRLGLALGVVGVSAALVGAFYFLQGVGVTDYALVAVTGFWLVSLALKRANWTRAGFSAVLILGFANLWARKIHGQVAFTFVSDKVKAFLELTNEGSVFLFGNLAKGEYFFPEGGSWPGFGFQFAFTVLPTIIFFSAFMSVMYHLGIVQVLILAMARFMRWSMRTSGCETMSCSANTFVGQTEAPFLIKPFISQMTKSELHAIMVGGFATVAGGVLAGYISMGVEPGHLIAASVMSAPAALVIAKLLFPETEEPVTSGEVELPEVKIADNVVGAAAAGVTDGLKLAANVGAMLIAFMALIAFVDVLLGGADSWIDGSLLGQPFDENTGEFAGVIPGSLKTIFGGVFKYLAFVMGVPWADAPAVGNLLGVKIAANEFVAYGILSDHIKNEDISPRAVTIATYALCGFANFASIGIQIGGIGALAPERRSDLAKLGMRAMFGGALASWMTATVAGILL